MEYFLFDFLYYFHIRLAGACPRFNTIKPYWFKDLIYGLEDSFQAWFGPHNK